MVAAGFAPAGSATRDLDPAELMTAHAEAVGAVCEAVEAWLPGDGGTATPCPEWTSHELLLHLACTAQRYHRILDDALAGEPQPAVLDDDLANLNRRELAASHLRGLPADRLVEVFADSAATFADRALRAWGAGPFQRDGVDVGPAVALAAIEWHVHAWDLRRALGCDYYPPHAELLRQGWASTVPHLGIDQDCDPWIAVLLAAGRDASRPSGRSNVTVREMGVDDVDPQEWDRCASSFYQTHAWLRAEAGTTDEPVTVLTAHRDGLVGGLTLYGSFEADTGAPTPEVAPLLAGGPLLRIGGLRGYSADIAAGPGPGRDEVAGALLQHSRTLARERGCRDVVFLWATEQAVRTARAAIPASPPLLLAADVSVPVPPGGVEGFLQSRAGRRRSVLREERRFARAGFRVERTTLEESWERCAPLLGALQGKYGLGMPKWYWRDLLASMAKTLPGSVVYLASDVDPDDVPRPPCQHGGPPAGAACQLYDLVDVRLRLESTRHGVQLTVPQLRDRLVPSVLTGPRVGPVEPAGGRHGPVVVDLPGQDFVHAHRSDHRVKAQRVGASWAAM